MMRPGGLRGVEEGRCAIAAGVADHNVESIPASQDFGDHRLDLAAHAYVGRHGHPGIRIRKHRNRCLRSVRLPDISCCDTGPCFGQTERDAATDAGAGASN